MVRDEVSLSLTTANWKDQRAIGSMKKKQKTKVSWKNSRTSSGHTTNIRLCGQAESSRVELSEKEKEKENPKEKENDQEEDISSVQKEKESKRAVRPIKPSPKLLKEKERKEKENQSQKIKRAKEKMLSVSPIQKPRAALLRPPSPEATKHTMILGTYGQNHGLTMKQIRGTGKVMPRSPHTHGIRPGL